MLFWDTFARSSSAVALRLRIRADPAGERPDGGRAGAGAPPPPRIFPVGQLWYTPHVDKTIRVDEETWLRLRTVALERRCSVRALVAGFAVTPAVRMVTPRGEGSVAEPVAPVAPTRPVASAGMTQATTSVAPVVPVVRATGSWTRSPIPKSVSARRKGPGRRADTVEEAEARLKELAGEK